MLSLREGSLELSSSLIEEGLELQKKLQQANPQELEKELQKQIVEKLSGCLSNIPAFYIGLLGFKRKEENIPVVWRDGSSYLYNYKATAKHPQPILIIPSLINRHYILDLEENNSFVKFLADNGLDVYLASWGEPTTDELDFGLDSYISRIGKMIDTIYKTTGQKIVLGGYCMGGLLAMAGAMERSEKLKSIAFFSTPWDFHGGNFVRFILSEENLRATESIIDSYEKIPAAFVQAIFYYMHFSFVGQKFETHPFLAENSHYKDSFLALESWANDGISMTRTVAKECFFEWVNNNNVTKLKWKSCGEYVSPHKISHLPAFFAMPKKDRIVPPACAMPLTSYFNNHAIIEPNAGHIGMIVGTSAKQQTWQPFLEWVLG